MSVLTFGLIITIAAWITASFILIYHWKMFAMNSKVTIATFVIYFFGSTLILALLLSAYIAIKA